MNTRRIRARSRRSGNSDSTRHRCARGSSRSPRTAFVLSGGGNQAVSQVGMPRCSSATSIPMWSSGAPRERGTDRWLRPIPHSSRRPSRRDVGAAARRHHLPRRAAVRVDLLTRDDHLFSDEGLRTVAALGRTPATFEDLAIPLRVVAADLDTGEEVVFACGRLRPALLASAALPGFPTRAVRRTAARRRRRGRHGAALARWRARSTVSTCSTCRVSSYVAPTGRRSTCS